MKIIKSTLSFLESIVRILLLFFLAVLSNRNLAACAVAVSTLYLMGSAAELRAVRWPLIVLILSSLLLFANHFSWRRFRWLYSLKKQVIEGRPFFA